MFGGKMKLVKEMYNFDIDYLYLLSISNLWFFGAYTFYCNIKDKEINKLSDHEKNWLKQISDKIKI